MNYTFIVMQSLFYILCFYTLGALVSWALDGFIPSSIMGMIILLIALSSKLIKPEKVRPASQFLLSNLMLFFVPVAVGVFGSFALFGDHIWAIVVSSLLSTVVVVVVVGGVAQMLIRRKNK